MIRRLLPDPGPVEGAEALEEFYLLPSGPHLRLDFVASLDGAVEVEGRSAPLGGPADRLAFMAMRAVADVVMVGAGTVRAESYGPVTLREGPRRRRAGRGQSDRPPLAVVTASGDLDPSARIFDPGSELLLLTTADAARRHPELAPLAEVIVCGESEVDPARALSELRDRGFGRVLCEGGPALTEALFAAGVVDELCLTLSPMLAGGGRRGLAGPSGAATGRFELAGLLEADGMLMARYRTRSRP